MPSTPSGWPGIFDPKIPGWEEYSNRVATTFPYLPMVSITKVRRSELCLGGVCCRVKGPGHLRQRGHCDALGLCAHPNAQQQCRNGPWLVWHPNGRKVNKWQYIFPHFPAFSLILPGIFSICYYLCLCLTVCSRLLGKFGSLKMVAAW